MIRTGVFRSQLNFKQFVGYSALLHSKLITQVGLLDKNDLAWQYASYDKLVEMLRAEFEVDKRVQNLIAKLDVLARDAADVRVVPAERQVSCA